MRKRGSPERLRSGLWQDDEERTEGTLEADVLCCARRMDQEAEEGGGQRPLSGAEGSACGDQCQMSGSGESDQYSAPAPAGVERMMNTDAGAPPAPPARGRGRVDDVGGRREVGHVDVQARGGAEWDARPHERAPEGGTLTGVSDERREEEEEPAAEAALLCSARTTDQFLLISTLFSNIIFEENNRQRI